MKIIRTICKGGKVRVATEGFVGGECLKATAKLKSDLGLTEETVEHTPEFYQAEVTEQTDVTAGH